MKKRNVKVHIFYWLFIAALTIVSAAIIVMMHGREEKLIARTQSAQILDRERLVSAIGQAESALRLAAHTASPSVYASKMQMLAEESAAAALLTEQMESASAWLIFWQRLSDFAEEEIERTVGTDRFSPDVLLLDRYADILGTLKESPDALKGALWEDLPEALSAPRLQTQFSLSADELRACAARALGVGDDLLKKEEIPMKGLARFHCSNAEIDLLISGQIVYLDLRLPRREGNIGKPAAIRRMCDFAEQEGYGKAEVIDLYEYEGILWAKMAPTVRVSELGNVKNMDCPLLAACTLWSGRVCHFEVNITQISEEGTAGALSAQKRLSERKMEKLAAQRKASLGETVIWEGKLCRTLILDREVDGGVVYLYLDAENGHERGIELYYLPEEDELPASAEWGEWDVWEREIISVPVRIGLPPSGEWQRRRFKMGQIDE